MYSEKFQKSIAAVEAARDKNIALEPTRMTAQQKTDLLAAYPPDYKQDEFAELQIGPNKGDKVPKELAEILQAHSRISAENIDLENPDYETDVLVIGGGGYMNRSHLGTVRLHIRVEILIGRQGTHLGLNALIHKGIVRQNPRTEQPCFAHHIEEQVTRVEPLLLALGEGHST